MDEFDSMLEMADAPLHQRVARKFGSGTYIIYYIKNSICKSNRLSLWTKGSRLPLYRYGSPLQCSFS